MSAAADIISIASSDDEEVEPPKKRLKQLTPILQECTLTPVKKKENKAGNKNSDIVNLLDSDEEDNKNENHSKKKPTNDKENWEVPNDVNLLDSDEEDNKNENHSKRKPTNDKENWEVPNDLAINPDKIKPKNGFIKENTSENTEPILLIDEDDDNFSETRKRTTEQHKNEKENKNLITNVELDSENSSFAKAKSNPESAPVKEIVGSILIDEDFETENEKTSKNVIEDGTEEIKESRETITIELDEELEETTEDNLKISKKTTVMCVTIDSKTEERKDTDADKTDDDNHEHNKSNLEEENICTNEENDADVISLPSTSKSSKVNLHNELLEKFIVTVEGSVKDSQFENVIPEKIQLIRKYFKKCADGIAQNLKFNTVIEENREKAKTSSKQAIVSMHNVYEFLKSIIASNDIVYLEDERDIIKLKKLKKIMRLLQKKIDALEQAEVNFDDDENSAYIQLDRYMNRFKKVHDKYCQVLKKNPYTSVQRKIYERVDFVNSSYNEINLAINKKYKNSVKFPTYHEIKKFITKVVKKENLEFSEAMIESESKKCFKKLGEIIKKKRSMELYESHSKHIENCEDPAAKDPALDNILKKNFADGKSRIDKLCEKFVVKQDLGEEAKLSSESDASNYENSDSDDS